jgi:hypothetical protein
VSHEFAPLSHAGSGRRPSGQSYTVFLRRQSQLELVNATAPPLRLVNTPGFS